MASKVTVRGKYTTDSPNFAERVVYPLLVEEVDGDCPGRHVPFRVNGTTASDGGFCGVHLTPGRAYFLGVRRFGTKDFCNFCKDASEVGFVQQMALQALVWWRSRSCAGRTY